jgi:integrase
MEQMKLSINTKKKAFIYFSALMNYAVKMDYIQKNPFVKIGNFKDVLGIRPKMNFYTPQEFSNFITTAKEIAEERGKLHNDLSEWNYYVFFNIAFYTGLRKGEIHALKWSDIDGAYLTVSRSIFQKFHGEDAETAPKNKSSIRTLQIPLPLLQILNEQKKRQQRLHNFTEDFRICNSIKDTSIQRKNKLYSSKAGLSKTIRIHDFRHPYVKPTTRKKF